MKRCIDSGLWVPNAQADEEAEKEPQDEEGEDRGAVTPDPGASHSPPALLQLHRLAQ